MSNPAELELVRKALQLGLGGCVEWDVDVVDRLKMELLKVGLTLEEAKTAMIEHVRDGGTVVQVKEVREHWKDRREYWYKVIVPMPDLFNKGLFIELELFDTDPELPEVVMVNAHEQH